MRCPPPNPDTLNRPPSGPARCSTLPVHVPCARLGIRTTAPGSRRRLLLHPPPRATCCSTSCRLMVGRFLHELFIQSRQMLFRDPRRTANSGPLALGVDFSSCATRSRSANPSLISTCTVPQNSWSRAAACAVTSVQRATRPSPSSHGSGPDVTRSSSPASCTPRTAARTASAITTRGSERSRPGRPSTALMPV